MLCTLQLCSNNFIKKYPLCVFKMCQGPSSLSFHKNVERDGYFAQHILGLIRISISSTLIELNKNCAFCLKCEDKLDIFLILAFTKYVTFQFYLSLSLNFFPFLLYCSQRGS